MQKWLDNHDILMYLRYHESKSVFAEWFIRPSMGKKKFKKTANNSKSCLCYLNKLGNEYNNNYHGFIGKKPIHTNHLLFLKYLN